MIVLDASATLELLLQTPTGQALLDRVLDPAESLAAPHLLDLEVAQVLRRYVTGRQLEESRAAAALEDLRDLPMDRYPHAPFLPRIWELRQHLTAYDAAYVALAETLQAPLPTLDRGIANAPGHEARIELLA